MCETRPLRSSAYLGVLCVEVVFNAENAEVRRGPQRNRLFLTALTTAAALTAVFTLIFAFVFLSLLLFLLLGSGQGAEGDHERGIQGFGTITLQDDGNGVGDILVALAFVFLPHAIRLAGHKFQIGRAHV